MLRTFHLKRLEVISVTDAVRLGFVHDLDIDENTGRIISVIVPKGRSFLERLWKRGEYVIPWGCITAAGRDLLLVDLSLHQLT